MKKINRLAAALGGSLVAFVAVMAAVTAMTEGVVQMAGEKTAQAHNWLLIQATYAQTAPESISEMSSEVTGFANTLMPAWLVYVVFALIAALGIWLIGRAIRAMKSS